MFGTDLSEFEFGVRRCGIAVRTFSPNNYSTYRHLETRFETTHVSVRSRRGPCDQVVHLYTICTIVISISSLHIRSWCACLLLLISPFGPRGCGRPLRGARHHQSLPIVYVTNADGPLHRSGVACVWACVWERVVRRYQ